MAKGFHQQPDIDFIETFSPVIKLVTIFLILTLAITCGWVLNQLDVNKAFLQGTLAECVFLQQPQGFVETGLYLAPRAWYNELRTCLLAYGFLNSNNDTSLSIYALGPCIMYLLVYMDDIILTSNHPSTLCDFTTQLSN